ncbi:MAG: hypothetical protein ACREH6_14270 [Geminicoccaceae bacterium]
MAGLTPHGAARAAAHDGTLLQPTPLILKDGRIADVSVHLVPFVAGAAEVAPAAARALAGLTRELATDCFLTAQVIGHVAADEVGPGDTLGAHRLARSRADAVQASLIAGGLPEKSIASVWDWQFLVREPRATLWVFRLIEGEDCDGTPLAPHNPSELVAERATDGAKAPDEPSPAPASQGTASVAAGTGAPAADGAVRVEPSEPTTVASLDRSAPASSAQIASPTPVEATSHADAAPTTPSADARGRRGKPAADTTAVGSRSSSGSSAQATVAAAQPRAAAPVEAEPKTAEAPGASVATTEPAGATSTASEARERAQPVPAVSPTARNRPADMPKPVAVTRTTAPAAAGGVGSPGPVARGGSLVITFANNSSYFPPGVRRELNGLLRGLSSGRRYDVVLQASVSGLDKVVGASSPAEARRYNKWLADRRLQRVQDWLAENAKGAELVVRPEFLADNEERQVIVKIAPADAPAG